MKDIERELTMKPELMELFELILGMDPEQRAEAIRAAADVITK